VLRQGQGAQGSEGLPSLYERGAGETMSSGTGSTGAAAAGILTKLVESPVTICTPAGPLELRYDDEIYLVGPAQIIGGGEFTL